MHSSLVSLIILVGSRFSSIYPDYRERVLRHEAAHLLVCPSSGVLQVSGCPKNDCQPLNF